MSTAWLRGDGRWVATVTIRGRRRYRYGKTPEQALARLAQLVANSRRGLTDGLRARSRRERAERFAKLVLDEAARRGWDADYTARVMVAQLSPSRIKRDVVGPCAYCGSWVAGTVDHVIARSQGGSDDAGNLTSACWSCNSRKGPRPSDSMSVSMAGDVSEAVA